MDVSGEVRIPADRETVWRALKDAAVLKACIPGCESFEQRSETEYEATVIAKVGPVKATFGGKVTLSDLDPPNAYTLSGEGTGAAGFARGRAAIRLREDGGETILAYTVDAQVGGRLAQVGARLLQGTSRKLAADFFSRFRDALPSAAPAPAAWTADEAGAAEAPLPAAPMPESPPPAEPVRGLGPAIWAPALIVVVALMLWYFAT
jgi:hypothetical protein